MDGSWMAVLQSILPSLHRVVVPIYSDTPEGITAVGSAVLVKIDQRPLLLTAAHVLDLDATSPLLRWSGPSERFIRLQGEAVMTKSKGLRRDGDRDDIGIVTLASETVSDLKDSDARFASYDILAEIGQEDGLYVLAGYPAVENELIDQTGANGRVKKLVQRELHRFYLKEAGADGYRRAGCTRARHFVASFLPQGFMSGNGVSLRRPKPYGMSGGGLFFIDIVAKKAPPRLAGIGIRYLPRKNLIVATRTDVLLEGLRSSAFKALHRVESQLKHPSAGF
jgi:hypothetical protein